jgi:hypothetical protein
MDRASGPLEMVQVVNSHLKERTGAPKARTISAWGNAPGMERTTRLRAESPIHKDGKTVWRELRHYRYVPPRAICLKCINSKGRAKNPPHGIRMSKPANPAILSSVILSNILMEEIL